MLMFDSNNNVSKQTNKPKYLPEFTGGKKSYIRLKMK